MFGDLRRESHVWGLKEGEKCLGIRGGTGMSGDLRREMNVWGYEKREKCLVF